jgi:hypothetical protein
LPWAAFCGGASSIEPFSNRLLRLSPDSGKTIVAEFDGGLLSSDGGILVLREVEQSYAGNWVMTV